MLIPTDCDISTPAEIYTADHVGTDHAAVREFDRGLVADAAATTKQVWFAPFSIIIDTREQAPFAFSGIHADAPNAHKTVVVPTVRKALPTGDYSLLNHESEITIERKSHEDLYSTLIDGRERFTREFERMTAGNFRFAAVVVEASWARIMQPPPGRKIHPKSISRSIMSFMLRYPTVQWITAPDRRFAECITYQLLAKFWDHQQAEAKARKQKAVLPAATTRKAVGV